jgi:predicted nucleic acid-binding protein
VGPPVRASSRRYVLDANALIGFFEDRPNVAEKVRRLMNEAFRQELPLFMSSVNWGEAFYMEWRYHGEAKARQIEAGLRQMPVVIVAVDFERATRAGALKQKHGLGYADAFAAELAIERSSWLVTADPGFEKVGKALSVYPLPRHQK